MLKARKDMFNRFKSYLFPIMSDTTPYVTPREISINEDSFINEIKNIKKTKTVKYLMKIFDVKIHHFQ